MKSKNTPQWILNGYKLQIQQVEIRIVELREAGLLGLIPEQVIILSSLKDTLNSLQDQVAALNN